MQFTYDTNEMKNVSIRVANKLTEFHSHSEAVKGLVTGLSASWSDPVNQQFATKYLQQGLVCCEKLEKVIKSYSDLMGQCANRYSSAIDNGNRFFNSF